MTAYRTIRVSAVPAVDPTSVNGDEIADLVAGFLETHVAQEQLA